MPTSCPKVLKETEGIEAEYASSQKKVERILIEIKCIWTADFPKQVLLKLNQNLIINKPRSGRVYLIIKPILIKKNPEVAGSAGKYLLFIDFEKGFDII